MLRPLEHRAISSVRPMRRRSNAALFSLKALHKPNVLASPSRVAHLLEERCELARFARASTVFVTALVDTFETRTYLYLVTHVARYGDLAVVLAQLEGNRLLADAAWKVFAEIVLGLGELPGMGYMYRNVMLHNLVLRRQGTSS